MNTWADLPVVRASGICVACDHHVRNELVLMVDPPAGRRTTAFVLELRHLARKPVTAPVNGRQDSTSR